MKLKKFEKVGNDKGKITFLEDYKQSHNKCKAKIPGRIVLKKENILLGILRKRQNFNETRTIEAVENCRRLVFDEIERFFEQKERAIIDFLPELIIGRKSYSHIFKNNDLETMYTRTEDIIKNELFKRFHSSIVWQVRKSYSVAAIHDIFSLIQKYQETKKRTVLITSYMEALARRTLSDSIDLLIKNSLLAKLACDIDLSTILLPKLGINSGSEIIELNEELLKRIGGALYSIKVGLIRELNNQIANIFYETHDLQLNTSIELKIHLLEDNIAFKIYDTDLLEA
ncbi:MAG: hypothetical protein P4L69_14395 [Desulfosporosinus sp.]|nr:hypothetical protein [Desulfosporosinus sp.]